MSATWQDAIFVIMSGFGARFTFVFSSYVSIIKYFIEQLRLDILIIDSNQT